MAGLPHLKDISHAAHPLDQDAAVARAWGQAAWADASGVSRTLQALTQAEAVQIGQTLQTISQPFIDQEVLLALRDRGSLVYDGDLTGRPVSNTSTTYPNVAYGHMSDAIHLGYQAALVSLHSPTYGRLWLSVTPHPGNTIACTQAEALVLAAETRTGVRPWRRVELLQERLAGLGPQHQWATARLTQHQSALAQAQAQLDTLGQQVHQWQREVARWEAAYTAQQRPARPHSRLAQARARLEGVLRRHARQTQVVAGEQQQVDRRRADVTALDAAQQALITRLTRYEQDNATNPGPITAVFRLDAGFGTGENVALLIELGYELYTKPYNHQVTIRLRRQVPDTPSWTRVGANAEMIAWAAQLITGCPYPLDLALERFYTGASVRYSSLLHYGRDPVTTDLVSWFAHYNDRQTIEAGIKEGKGVFQMHHLKVRTLPALLVQEQSAVFAANFVRWAAHWLASCCPSPHLAGSPSQGTRVKELVQVGAHMSAWVEGDVKGCVVRFTDQSAYAGHVLATGEWVFQLPLPLFKSCDFGPI